MSLEEISTFVSFRHLLSGAFSLSILLRVEFVPKNTFDLVIYRSFVFILVASAFMLMTAALSASKILPGGE